MGYGRATELRPQEGHAVHSAQNSMVEPSSEHLATLLADAAQGDQIAWRSIVELFLPRVLAVIRSQCHDHDLAEEITQSAFCTVVSKLPEYQEGGRFESWLMRIAMNRLRDEMRRRKRHAMPAEESTLIALAGAHGEVGPEYSDAQRRMLMEAMDGLSNSDREILVLRHVSGLSFKELSEALEAPVGTLLARHHRALKKLKALLEVKNDTEEAD